MFETFSDLILQFQTPIIQPRLDRFAKAINETSAGIRNCVGLIDTTVIGMARPGADEMRRDFYNAHKRKHALKYQAVTTPDGIFFHMSKPVVGRRHDWYMYIQSGLDEILPEALLHNWTRYCI